MSRVLLDVDFNDQTTNNHALNSDWDLSYVCDRSSNRNFELIENDDYCLFEQSSSNRGITYTPKKLSNFTIMYEKNFTYLTDLLYRIYDSLMYDLHLFCI